MHSELIVYANHLQHDYKLPPGNVELILVKALVCIGATKDGRIIWYLLSEDFQLTIQGLAGSIIVIYPADQKCGAGAGSRSTL